MMMSGGQQEDDTNASLLGQNALSVCCDVHARDLGMESEKLSATNATLAPIYQELTQFHLKKSGESLLVIDILEFSSHDDTHFIYNVNEESIPECPLEEIKKLRGYFCGFPIVTSLGLFSNHPIFSMDEEGAVRMTYKLSDFVSVSARVVAYEGTPEEVRDMIDEEGYNYHFSRLELINVQTRQHARTLGTGHVPMNGAMCKFETVLIKTTAVSIILALEGTPSADDWRIQEGQLLNNAYPKHNGIREATDRYQELLSINQKLIGARNIYQSLEGHGQDGSVFRFDLVDGKVDQMTFASTDDEFAQAWMLEPRGEETPSILLSSLANLNISLGNMTICGPRDNVNWGRPISLEFGFALKYRGVLEVELIFMYDDSIIDIINNDGADRFLDRVAYTMIPENSNVTMPGIMRMPGMTVTLAYVAIGLEGLKSRLDRLGIDSAVEEETGGDSDQAEPGSEDGAELEPVAEYLRANDEDEPDNY